MQKDTHILVIRMSAMGDVAMTVPVIQTLLTQHPQVKITMVSKPFLKPVFDDMKGVDFFAADVQGKHKGLIGIFKLYRELKKLNINAVADLHHVLRSKILRFLFKINGLPIAFINKGRTEKKALTALRNKIFKPLKTTHQRYADVFEKLGYPINLLSPAFKTKINLTEQLKNIIDFSENQKLIGIAPFAAHQGKKYPLALMLKVVTALSKNHTILLFGGGKEETETLSKIANKTPNVICMAGKTKLKEELSVISNLCAMISMDSGNGHFSAMFGIPTISIWGATHPYAGFAPFNQQKNCLTADRKKYPLLPTSVYGNKITPGYEDVMHSILPETIIKATLKAISN